MLLSPCQGNESRDAEEHVLHNPWPSDSTLVSYPAEMSAPMHAPWADPQTGDPIDGPAEHKIRDEGEKEGHVDRFDGINAAEHYQLVHEVEDDRQHCQLPNRDESLADQATAVIGVADNRREKRRSPGTGVAQSVADGEQRGHRRLHEQAKR